MTKWVRHVDEPAPVLKLELVKGASRYARLPTPLFYAVQWTTNRSLFSQPAGRSTANFYPLDLTRTSGYSRYEVATSALPGDVWDFFTSDPNQQYLYVRFGVGEQLDPAHSSWDWSNTFSYLLNHDPRAEAGPEINAHISNGKVQGDVELYGGNTTDPEPNTNLTYHWQLVDTPKVDLSKSANRGFIRSVAKRVANASGPRVTAVPKGTAVPAGVRGTYQFNLEVVDDDKSTYYGNRGRDSDTTTVKLGTPPGSGDIRVTRPTTGRQEWVQRPTEEGVRIEWEIDGGLYQALERKYGLFMLMLQVESSESSQGRPSYTTVSRGKPPKQGSFTWHLYDADGFRPDPGPYNIYLSLVGENQWSQVSASGYSTSTTEEKALYLDPYRFWTDLVSFRPPASVQRAVHNDPDANNAQIQPIEDGSGVVNLDYYPVRIETFPTVQGRTLRPADFVDHVRLNMNSMISISWFNPGSAYFIPWGNRHKQTWTSSSPTGAIIFLNLFGPDNAAVVCSAHGRGYWRFSTIYTSSSYYQRRGRRNPVLWHPVSGNREWGISPNDDGSYTFYTRAADRLTWSALPDEAYAIADDLWRGLQQGVSKFVNSNGGKASVEAPTAIRPPWDHLKDCCHNPKRSWVYQ